MSSLASRIHLTGDIAMHYDSRRRMPLVRETLVADSERLPSAVYTAWTMGLIAVCLMIIASVS